MNRIAGLAGAFALGLTLSPLAPGAQAEELKMIGAFPEGFVYTREMALPFIEMIAAETGGAVSIEFLGPDAAGPLEQFEPTQAGVFDLLFTHPAYHAGVTPVGLAIDAIGSDPAKRRDGGVIDYIDAHYQALGLKLVAAPATGTKGFRYYLRQPVAGEPAFAGLKIRGTVSYHPMIETLGGSGVVMGGGDVYAALQKGVVDGAAWGLTGAKDFKWNEVAGYMVEPEFGQVGVMIFMNFDRWNGLTDEERAAFERVALKLETESIAQFDRLAAEEKAALIDLGMKETSVSASEATRFETLWSEGAWSVAAKTAPEATAELREIARKAGLSD